MKKQAIRLQISPSIKDKKGKRPSAILNKFIILRGVDWCVLSVLFRKVSFSSVHTYTRKQRFQKVPLWRAFSKSSVFINRFHRILVVGSCIRKEKVAFSNENGYVWTGPNLNLRFLRFLVGLRESCKSTRRVCKICENCK